MMDETTVRPIRENKNNRYVYNAPCNNDGAVSFPTPNVFRSLVSP